MNKKILRQSVLPGVFLLATALPLPGDSILFIGNPTTTGEGAGLTEYHTANVTELNGGKTGGIPALFKTFTTEAGLNYVVSAETANAAGIDYHVDKKAALIGQPWDHVVMHGFSTLDQKHPGDAALLVKSAKQASDLLHAKNPGVEIWLLATWPRADLTYMDGHAWSGKSIDAMTRDIRSGYDAAAANSPFIKGVIPVGDAWSRAFKTGVADPNPYDGITAGQLNLWSPDSYHASVYGYYLATLMVFGEVTGLDPRSLGKNETAAAELKLGSAQAEALQKVAYDELSSGTAVRTLKKFRPAGR